jgi:DNA-binding transcriptional LysR family regulator
MKDVGIMDLEGLKSFVIVAREKSISKAAQILHISQPTLSARLKNLEDAMGVQLLNRSWEGVRLTEQGQYFLLYATQIVKQFDNTSAIINEENIKLYKILEEIIDSRRLNIGFEIGLSNLFITPLISEIRDHYPDLDFKFMVRPSALIVDLLEHNVLDLGIFIKYELEPKIRSVHLIDEKLVLLCSNEFAQKNELTGLEIFKNLPFILFENLSSFYLFLDKLFFQMLGKNLERVMIIDTIEMMAEIVSSGYGYTVVPKPFVTHPLFRTYPMHVIPLPAYVADIYLGYSDTTSIPVPIETLAKKLSEYYRNNFFEPF